MSHARAVAALPEARLAAVVDVDESRARAFATQFNVPICETGLATVLDRDDIDAVIVTTANDHHAPLTIQALEAGKHVIVQKPMARPWPKRRDDRRGRAFGQATDGFVLRVLPSRVQTRQGLVDSGAIGDVFLYKAIMAWTSGSITGVSIPPSPAAAS